MPDKIMISPHDLLELVHLARRYADQRMTFVPSTFNEIYARLVRAYPKIMRTEKPDVVIKNMPWATDGMEGNGFDARPFDWEEIEKIIKG